jgi:hypothetical protein
MTYLETRANEESTYIITITTDFTADTMLWSLTDEDGTAINTRSSETIAAPTTSNEVTLTGDDLAVSDARRTRRVFTVWGTYNGGANKFADECTFDVRNLKGVS